MAADLKQITDNPRPVKTISGEVLARSRLPVGFRTNPFTAPSFPPAVVKAMEVAKVPTLAQDDMISSTMGWAAADQVVAAYNEGLVFLGYSYLAVLSQRPEYRVVSEVISTEMTREWIDLKVGSGDESKNDKIKFLEDEMDRLSLRDAFRKVTEGDGFFGRGHLYLDTGMTDDSNELKMDIGNGRNQLSKLKIGPDKKQKLIAVRPVEATWAYPTNYESIDPLKSDWYKPRTWYVMSREIHRSRFLTFVGREVPDILKPAYAFGGLSMSQMLKPYVDNWLRTRQSVSDLIQNFSVNVLRTNMDATTSVGGEALFSRVALFNNVKNNQGTMVIDKDSEDWANVSVPLGGLDSLQAQSQEHMACCRADTLIETERGQIPICEVTIADRVMTRKGAAPIAWAGQTGHTHDLIEIRTPRSCLLVTPHHPIYLPQFKEFVLAESVQVGDRLSEAATWPTSMASQSHGAVDGGGLLAQAITETLEAAASCIAAYGKRIRVLSRQASLSTIGTRTPRTIASTISNWLPAPIIMPSTLRTAGAGAAIAIPSCAPRLALFAAPSSPPTCRPESIATIAAPSQLTSVVSVRRVKTDEPVYNLDVADGYLPEFYANGVLVHNSISRIPLVKLLGIQPAGLNASSEGELIAFEDWIAAFQELFYRVHLTTIIDLIQLSTWGKIDDDITFDFKPLRQQKPDEKASLDATIAQTREAYLQMGAVQGPEIRELLAEDPDSPFQGLDLSKQLPAPPMPGPGELGGMPGAPPPVPGGGGAPMPPPGGAGGPGGGASPRLTRPGGLPPGGAPDAAPFSPQALVAALNNPEAEAPENDNTLAQGLVDALNAAHQQAGDAEFDENKVKRNKSGEFTSGGGAVARATGAVKGAAQATAQLAGQALKDYSKGDYHALRESATPDSPERNRISQGLAAIGNALPNLARTHLREEKHKAVHAAGALRAISTGNRPTSEQWRGLRQFAISMVMSAGMFLATGDPTGSVGHVAAQIGGTIVEHTMLSHGTKLGIGTIRHATGVGSGDAAFDELSPEDIKLLQKFLEHLAEVAASYQLPDEPLDETATPAQDAQLRDPVEVHVYLESV